MSTALAYSEPYRFSAGLLALIVHLAFFALLYFGVHWQSRPPESFVVEMWDNLPDTEVGSERATPASKLEPMPPRRVVAPALPPAKADIEVRDKKNSKADTKEKPDKKNQAKEKAAAMRDAERKELEAWSKKVEQEHARTDQEQKRIRAEVNVATQVQVERYQDLIRNKIRRKIIKLADVPDSAEVIFKVTLLPDGMLMDNPVLVKSSGIRAYDEAVERAILAAEPLPVPADVSLQKTFRELKLSIRP